MFTNTYDVVFDPKREAEMHLLAIEPYLCPSCEEAWIEPKPDEHYDEDEGKVYEYYFHYCGECGFEEYLDSEDENIVHIIKKDQIKEQERKKYEKLYDRRLV